MQSSKFINYRNFNLYSPSTSSPSSSDDTIIQSSPLLLIEPVVNQLTWYTATNNISTINTTNNTTNNRRKSSTNFKKKQSTPIPFKEFQSKFKYTKEIAMKSLGLSHSEMNSYCKQFNINRWPYRRAESIRVRKSYVTNLIETQGVRILNDSSICESDTTTTTDNNCTIDDELFTKNTLTSIINNINSIETEISINPSTDHYNELIHTIILPVRKNNV